MTGDERRDPTDAPDTVPQPDPRDLALIDELRAAALRLDPVPPSAVTAARESLALRRLDSWLAELTRDTTVDELALAGVRGAPPRLLTFEADGLTVEVEVTATAGSVQLVGQLVPPQPARIEVHHRGGISEVRADELGRFSAGDIARGPTRLLCTPAGDPAARATQTDWVVL